MVKNTQTVLRRKGKWIGHILRRNCLLKRNNTMYVWRNIEGAFVWPLLYWKSNAYLHILSACMFSLRYPACNAHAPYCHLWPAALCGIFPHYLINDTIFGGKKNITVHQICVLIFCTSFFLSETFLVLWRNERDITKNVWRSSCKVPFIPVRF